MVGLQKLDQLINLLKDTKQRYSNRKPIKLPPDTEEENNDDVLILELEAEALTLELELLAA